MKSLNMTNKDCVYKIWAVYLQKIKILNEKTIITVPLQKITLLHKDNCGPGPLWTSDNAGLIQVLATCTKGEDRMGLYLKRTVS